MKKLTFMACAAMLASTVALNSCKSNDPVGSFEGNAEVVKTEFAIALPDNAVGGPRKMPANTVQTTTDKFQGMKNMVLIPFAKADTIKSTDVRLGGTNIALGTISKDTTFNASNHSKVYSDVAIPLTTASFLFYGESAVTGENNAKGVLTAANIPAGAPSGISFSLSPIVAGTIASITATGVGANLIALLNKVENAEDSNNKHWKNYVKGTDDKGMTAMDSTYRTMKALSSPEVLRVLSDLYESVQPLTTGADPVKTLAKSIQDSIKTAVSVTGASAPFTFAWKTDDYKGFPDTTHNIPAGAIRVKYDGGFVAYAEADYTAASLALPTRYTYPSSLWYFANSQIKTANTTMMSHYTGSENWTTILAAYTGAAAVNSLTRSVVIVDTIQYAVARLDITVALSGNTLKDKLNHDINCTAGFPVKGVLVGGQKDVDFKFEPSGATEYTIYDNVMTSDETATMTRTSANSTLVLETAGGNDKDVKIAVEFINNTGEDFVGVDGQLIRKGGKFYLIATLPSAEATQTDKKVFKQDYTTTANLTITSLAKAYTTIPDLRTPKLELGMTVDLNWKSGHTYDVNFD